MCKKSPSINYVYRKIRTTKKTVLQEQLKDCPITNTEYHFICDVMEGLSITELADKYNKSLSRTSQWKRQICEKIHAFDMANIKR